MLNLSRMYGQGFGVEQNYTEALSWVRKAVEAEDPATYPEAMRQLGMHYAYGMGVPLDYGQARHWLLKAAQRGDALAMAILGGMALEGLGMPKDPGGAVGWFERAVEAGNAQAMCELGKMYFEGSGAEDLQKGLHWLGRAAAAGVPEAMTWFGTAQALGHGLPTDSASAARWLFRAVSHNDEKAVANLKGKAASFSPEFRLAFQTVLKEARLYTGPLDGEFSLAVLAAIDALAAGGPRQPA